MDMLLCEFVATSGFHVIHSHTVQSLPSAP
jgi:hypothetical protein